MSAAVAFTERQLELIDCIERHLSVEEAAEEMGISRSAAKQHADAVRRKLNVSKIRQVPAAFRSLNGAK